MPLHAWCSGIASNVVFLGTSGSDLATTSNDLLGTNLILTWRPLKSVHHLSEDRVPDRRTSRIPAFARPPCCAVLSGAHRGTDSPLPGDDAAVPSDVMSTAATLRSDCPYSVSVCSRGCSHDGDREHVSPIYDAATGGASSAAAGLDRRDRVYSADLFRFLRPQRHGSGWPASSASGASELRFAAEGHEHHRL